MRREAETVDNPIDIDSREPSTNVVGRVIGMIVFLGGIGMLAFVFYLAFAAFNNPNLLVPLDTLKHTPPPSPVSVYLRPLIKLILLFAMGYFGSLIASRGAQLFFSSRGELRRVATGD